MRGRRTDTWHVTLQGRAEGQSGGGGSEYDVDDESSHNFTGRQSDDWISLWVKWMNTNQQADDECECQFEYSVEYWVPLGGTPPPHSSLCILNIWHERKGIGWGRLRLRLRFYILSFPATPSRPEYRKGCLCCGIPMHSVWKGEKEREGEGGRESSRGRVR